MTNPNPSSHSILRPGFMVSLRSSVTGGVSYARRELDPAEVEAGVRGESVGVSRWETTKIVEDTDEHARAVSVRAEARRRISAICIATSFGLLCPESREEELFQAVREARALVAEHNASARVTEVSISVLTGRVASSDEESARAVGEEVRSLIEDMGRAIDRLDVDEIRRAATKAADIGAMLSPEASATVGAAVEAARRAARTIVKRVEKGGEEAAVVLADIQRGAIEKARIAFLDLDVSAAASSGPELPAVDVRRVGEIDLAEAASEIATLEPGPAVARALEIAESACGEAV